MSRSTTGSLTSQELSSISARAPAVDHLTSSGGSLREYSSTSTTSVGSSVSFQTKNERRGFQESKKKATVTDRHALAEHQREALAHSIALEQSAAANDAQDAAIAGLDLKTSLRQLWRLRHVRSDDWATIVSKLQMVLSEVAFEQFTQEMATSIRLIIESHLRPDSGNDDVRASTVLLQRAGLDPWKCIVDKGVSPRP